MGKYTCRMQLVSCILKQGAGLRRRRHPLLKNLSFTDDTGRECRREGSITVNGSF